MARALRVWAINRGGKNSVRNLRCGPRTRLVRGIYIQLTMLILGLPQGSPRLKMLFVIFFCLQPQIAVCVLKRMRAFLLSLRMHMIREHAETHMIKKNGAFISSVVLERKHE